MPGFEFFERDPDSGRLREFDEAFGEEARQRYHERVYDLAHEICQLLKRLNTRAANPVEPAPESTGKTIFLAATTTDLQPQRDQLQRELIELGHQVLPNRALPFVAGELETAVRGCLAECDLAIHMIGDRYGLVPEDTDLSIVAIQNNLAAQHSRECGLNRLIWMPRGNDPRDERQAQFIRDLTRNPDLHVGSEIISDTLENFKESVEEFWRTSDASPDADPDSHNQSDGPPRIYLIYDREDETAIEAIEDDLYGKGIEVITPAFDGDEARTQALHIQNLKDCDAALVYFGAAPKAWVDIKVRDLIKATGYRDARPIDIKAVYLAPPFDRRKERYKSLSAEVIRQQNEFDPGLLDDFVKRLKPLQ